MVIFPSKISDVGVSLRIVPAPAPGLAQSPTYTAPRMFVINAGMNGQTANRADLHSMVATPRSNETATGSPNTVTPVGSAGTAGLNGTPTSKGLLPVSTARAIVGLQHLATAGPTAAPTGGATDYTNWTKVALVGGGILLAVLVLK
jgi:hypothetical protein